MTNALVLDMPVELGLKLVAIIGSHFFDAERELGDDIVDEGDGIGLIVALIDFESPDAGCIVNGGVLITLDRFVIFVREGQELNIDLDLVAGDLFLIPDGVNFAQPRSAWQLAYPIAFEDTINTCAIYLDVMVAGEIPDDANRPEMVSLAQMHNLLDNFWRCSVDRVLGNRLLVDQSSFTGVFIQSFPTVKANPCNAEVSAGFNSTAKLFCMVENAQFALNIAFVLVHRDHPLALIGS